MSRGKAFFFKLTLICLCLLVIDWGLGSGMAFLYFRIKHGEQGRITKAAQSVTAPVLILGSSRAVHHYIPGIIRDSLHMECYNAGKDRQGLFYDLAMLTMVLERYTPRLIILDLNPDAFGTAESNFDDLAVLLPYYRSHPEIRPILDKRSKWEWLKTRSRIYCYNSLILQIAKNTLYDREEDSVSDGYLPKFNALTKPPAPGITSEQLYARPDAACIAAFVRIITLARRSGCQLAVVVSPTYHALEGSSTIRLARDICAGRSVPFLDFTRSPAFTTGTPALFYDDVHLDDAGAQRFTRMVCADLIAKGFH